MTRQPDTQPKLREFGTGLRDRLYHRWLWRAELRPEREIRPLVRPR
jgi:hypothetical protein